MIISPLGSLKLIVPIFVSRITDKIGYNLSALKEIHIKSCFKKRRNKHDLSCEYALKHFEETDH